MGAARPQDDTHLRHPRGTGPSPVRVVLVGRTGLDARLRLEPSFELVRVRSALEAVGELSDPVDPGAPVRSVVIVAPETDPGAGHADAAEETMEFLSALRLSDPRVRVLRLAPPGSDAGPYDGIVNSETSAEALRAAVRGPADAEPPQPTGPAGTPDAPKAAPVAEAAPPDPRPRPDSEPPTVSVTSEAGEEMLAGKRPPAPMSDVGDETLARELITGRDITDAAVELIRRRLGARDVAFVTRGLLDAERPPQTEEDHESHVASVSWKGRLLGRLRSREAASEQLAPHAAWLAAWLMMREQHLQLRDAAFTDHLTGAGNRRFFDHFLASALESARRDRQPLTVLAFDIDDFKRFNDQHGHAAGDDILIEVVRLMKSVIRPADKVCRIGGDEFAVVFYEPTGPRSPTSRPPSSVFEIAQRFQREIANHKFPKLGREAPGSLSISGGLATFPWDGSTPAELLARADELACDSKRRGKNAINLGPWAERENGGT